ncbi:hypothetical protein HYC85_022822 [Camellia sinensis]|uniref:Peptidyl-prolyl cis-trans isomerase n=1 Tax=Camellia sinensis TaxID=4442 RepID=A0A7J7GCP8_CAMSI|nr:hypothetical protein HYC85_022822 [Camellia sinensis]
MVACRPLMAGSSYCNREQTEQGHGSLKEPKNVTQKNPLFVLLTHAPPPSLTSLTTLRISIYNSQGVRFVFGRCCTDAVSFELARFDNWHKRSGELTVTRPITIFNGNSNSTSTIMGKDSKANESGGKGKGKQALAAEYSECPSGKKGGDLGWFPRGKMTGPFQDVAFSTPVGATSAQFKSTPAISVMLLMAHVWIPHYLVRKEEELTELDIRNMVFARAGKLTLERKAM